MMRVRLKADGRLVEILADGSERAMPPVPLEADGRILAPSIQPGRPPQIDASYARRIRSQTRLTRPNSPRASACRSRRCATGSRASARHEVLRARCSR